MELDTDRTVYICTDGQNGQVHLLVPRQSGLWITHLQIDNPDPEWTDAAEFRLLRGEMNETTVDV